MSVTTSATPRGLDPATLAFLHSVDSPTIANAIETFDVRDRTTGFVGGAVQCQFPELGRMVGRALTVTMTSHPGPVADRAGYWRMWEALDAMEGPVVIAVQDVSGAPHRCAYAGEVMSTLAKRLGAVGMITDGALRDVDEVRALGFHYFMRYPVVSHGNFEIGDRNGIVVVPDAVLAGLPDAVATIQEKEQRSMEFIRGGAFTLEAFKTRSGY